MIGVIKGRDDFLFLDNDTNRSVDQIEGRYACDRRFLASVKLCHDIRAFVAQREFGGEYQHAIVPNKESVLRDYLGEGIRWAAHGLPPVYKYKEMFPDSLSFFAPDFADPQQISRYFARTDTHWTHFAALEYLKAFFRKVAPALEVELNRLEIRHGSTTQLGDLGGKLELPPEKLEVIQPLKPQGKQVFTNGVQNEGCVRHFVNDAAPIKELVMLNHDSTSGWLFCWLAELFSSVLCVHCADFDGPLLMQLRPRYNFFVQIERFFVRLPLNEFNLYNFVKDQETRKQAKINAVPYIEALVNARG